MSYHKLSIPSNCTKTDDSLFKEKRFEVPRLSTYKLSNVEVTFDGICIVDQKFLLESVYRYRDNLEECYLSLQFINRCQFLLSEKHILIHSTHRDIFHWITDSIPRLIMVQHEIESSTLLIPEGFEQEDFVKESLHLFQIRKVVHIRREESIRAQHLILPELKSFYPIFNPSLVTSIRTIYTKWITPQIARNKSFQSRIYIELPVTGPHIVVNKKGIERTLEEFGFTLLDLSKVGFIEGIKAIHKAEFLVGFDSPNLVYLNFLCSGASVLELKYPVGNHVDNYAGRYWRLSSCLSLKYYYQFGTHRGYYGDESAKAIEFDTRILCTNLTLMTNRSIKRKGK